MHVSKVAICTLTTLIAGKCLYSTPTASSTVQPPNAEQSEGKSTQIAKSAAPSVRSHPVSVSTPTFEFGQPLAQLPSFSGDRRAIFPSPASAKSNSNTTLPSFAPQPLPQQRPASKAIAFNSAATEDYRLGAGDRLKIDFLNFPEYTGETQVLVDGSVNLALVGKIDVSNLTLEQASATIQEAYAYYVRRPSLTVSLLVPRPLRLGVSGEVNRPGTYTIAVGETAQFPTATQAIEQAGGFTQTADLRQVQIRRLRPNGSTQTFAINLWDVLQGVDLTQDWVLRDGDTIVVPASTRPNLAEAPQMADASFAARYAQPMTVVVVGEVSHPGSHSVAVQETGDQPRLTQALEVAGGITPTADIGRIQVRRTTRDGTLQTLSIDLWQLLNRGDATQDPILQPGDTIVVPTATEIDRAAAQNLAAASFASDLTQPVNVAVVGEVARPGPHTINAGGGSSAAGALPTVTHAIQVAGGITQLANVRGITVRRFTRDGTEQTLEVDLWQLLRQGDLQQDVLLLAGDTVIIPTATAVSPAEATALADASFSPEAIAVNVVGEVGKPGAVQVEPNAPLNQAIMAAGGFNNRASRGTVELIRLNPDGTVERRKIEVDLSAGIDPENNPSLMPDDVVIVKRSGLSQVADVAGQILPPLNILRFFNLFGD